MIKQSSKEDKCCRGKRAKIGVFMRFLGVILSTAGPDWDWAKFMMSFIVQDGWPGGF